MGTDINNLSKLKDLHNEIQGLIADFDTPTPNPSLLSKIQLIASEANGIDDICYSCFLHISNEASIYYSDRKHRKYFYGADESYSKIKMHLDSIAIRIAEIKAAQDK